MGDRSRRRIGRDFAAADGEDDEPLAVRGALRAASAGLRICGADCESGSGVKVVSGATRASDGFRVLGAWFGGSGCAAVSELFDSGVWLAACSGNRRACADGSVTSRWNLDYAVNSGTIRAAPGWRIQKQLSRDSDRGHDFGRRARSRRNGGLLTASLAGRILVGYAVDHVRKKDAMSLFYFLMGASVLLLEMTRQPAVAWAFAFVFGFSMGADYMLIPLVTAESFGTASLGKLIALIIMGYSLGQWGFPWIVGRLFDANHSYDLAWKITALAGMTGGLAIYAVSPRGEKIGA